MSKSIVCLGVYLTSIFTLSFQQARAGEPLGISQEMRLASCVHSAYEGIDFSNSEVLSYDAFASAYKGYLNLKEAGQLSTDKQILSICDFNLASSAKRLWIIDLASGKVLFNTYVAHGQGSGGDYANEFSNSNNSHQSSLGFYVTGDTYQGEHGLSLRLQGMDRGFNDAALQRGIVVHGADYVNEGYIAGNLRLGRSWGCPAVPDELKIPIINAIEGGTCLFIYHNDARFSKKCAWLNKVTEHLPETHSFEELAQAQLQKKVLKLQVVHYSASGKTDTSNTYAN